MIASALRWGPVAAALLLAACAADPGGDPPRPASRESLSTILAHADAAFRDGDYAEAQTTYEEALTIDPDHAAATANLATAYLHNRAVKKARDRLEGFLGRHPNEMTARLVLARVLIRQGELEAAAEALRAVVAAQPDLLIARYNLGFVAYRLRRYDEAETHLQRSVALRPDFAEAHYTLGLAHLARRRMPQALAALERAVALDGRHVGARFNLARAYRIAGRDADAAAQESAYADLSGRSKADQERDTQIKASSVRAIRFIQEKKHAEALAEYESLARRFPGHAPLFNEIGRLQIRLGRRQEARASFEKAIALDPRLSEPHYLIAGLYSEAGDHAAAERELQIFATLETIPEGKSGY